MTIADILIPKLQKRFADRRLDIDVSRRPFVVIPAIHPAVGDILIYDDGDELTVVAGNFTHDHFSNFDASLSAEQKAERIAEDVVGFLDDLFADRVVLWGSNERSGGWYVLGADQREFATKGNEYVWSGPLSMQKISANAVDRPGSAKPQSEF